jgi:hypothetical protein
LWCEPPNILKSKFIDKWGIDFGTDKYTIHLDLKGFGAPHPKHFCWKVLVEICILHALRKSSEALAKLKC